MTIAAGSVRNWEAAVAAVEEEWRGVALAQEGNKLPLDCSTSDPTLPEQSILVDEEGEGDKTYEIPLLPYVEVP